MSRQKDYTASAVKGRTLTSRLVLQTLIQKRRETSLFASSACLMGITMLYKQRRDDLQHHLERSNRISTADFSFNFNSFSEASCLSLFRFRKADLIRVVRLIGWPQEKVHTSRNRYSVSPILACCVMLRRIATPARWRDLEELFGKHGPQLSEIFWEAVVHFLEANEHLLTSPISADFFQPRLARYAEAIHAKSKTLDTCIGFIDGTVLGIARPKGNLAQRVVYNGHKRKHALKYQAVNTPDGLIQHVYGPLEGRRHDWTLYIRSELDEVLPMVLEVDGVRYCIYGDSGYNARWYMEVPFQGATLSAAQKAFNKAMSSVRISVEWLFKEIKMHFVTVDFKRKMKVLESPIGMLYMASMVFANFRNCLCPNQISKYFGVAPPNLEKYANHK